MARQPLAEDGGDATEAGAEFDEVFLPAGGLDHQWGGGAGAEGLEDLVVVNHVMPAGAGASKIVRSCGGHRREGAFLTV